MVITPWLSDFEQRRLAGLGVTGIFVKQRFLADLIDAIREVASGQTWFDRQSSSEDTPNGTLSRQERTAAESVLEGLANKEIAGQMGVSESCVKALLQRAFLKLGVHNRSQLVRVLVEKSIGVQPGSDGLSGSMGRLGTREAVQRDLSVAS